jgi:hypothetical protein
MPRLGVLGAPIANDGVIAWKTSDPQLYQFLGERPSGSHPRFRSRRSFWTWERICASTTRTSPCGTPPSTASRSGPIKGEPDLQQAIREADVVVLLQAHQEYLGGALDGVRIFDTRGVLTGESVERL